MRPKLSMSRLRRRSHAASLRMIFVVTTPPEAQLEIVDMLNANTESSQLDIRQVFQKHDRLIERFFEYKGEQTATELGGPGA